MANLPRILQKIFGSTGGSTNFGQFGSEAAGAALKTKDLDLIQARSQYDQGWYSATDSAGEPPRIEDFNGLQLLFSSQISYLFQKGIPEWITTENYYLGVSVVQVAGDIYLSKTDNIGKDPTSNPSDWLLIIPSTGALGIAANLSDLADAPTARTNLDVYSKAEIDDLIMPVGSTYMQHEGETDPGSLYAGTWSNISSNYAGNFMRIEGGDAKAFGTGEQPDQLQEHGHLLLSGDSAFGNVNGYPQQQDVNFDNGTMDSAITDVLETTGGPVNTGTETRPVNRTVRIWKRTA